MREERNIQLAVIGIVAVIMLLSVMGAVVQARHESGLLTWGYSTATTATRDTLIQATADTTGKFKLTYRPNRRDGEEPERVSFYIVTTQITDSTDVTYYLDGSMDGSSWVALVTGPTIDQTDISADVDSAFTVAGSDVKGMMYGRIRAVPAMAAGDSISTTITKSITW